MVVAPTPALEVAIATPSAVVCTGGIQSSAHIHITEDDCWLILKNKHWHLLVLIFKFWMAWERKFQRFTCCSCQFTPIVCQGMTQVFVVVMF